MPEYIESPKESFSLKRELIELGIFMLAYAILTSLVTLFMGLALGGFEDVEFLKKFQFYYWGLVFAGGVITIKLLEILTKGKYFDAVIHDPSQPPSFFHIAKIKVWGWVKDPLKFLGIWFLITMVVGLFAALANVFFTAAPQYLLAQQVSEISKVGFGVEPAVTAETLGLFAFLIAISLTIPKILSKGKINPTIFYILCYFVIPVIIGILWMLYHSWHYGGEEVSLLTTFIFGLVSAELTMLFHSIIPAWCLHFNNNLFFTLNKMYSDETIVIATILFVVISLFLIIMSRAILKKRKK